MAAEDGNGFFREHKVEVGALSAVGMLALIWGGKKLLEHVPDDPEQSGGVPEPSDNS